jgi:hypothetical protein
MHRSFSCKLIEGEEEEDIRKELRKEKERVRESDKNNI